MRTDAETVRIRQHGRRAYPHSGGVARKIARMGYGVVAARVQLVRHLRRQTQAEFAREVGVSPRIIGAFEAAEPRRYDPATVHRVESAIGWAPGSYERVLSGRRPIAEIDPLLARIMDAWPRLPDAARRMLADLAGAALRE